MILTGPEIKRRVESGDIQINPFREEQLNPASYDLRLGNQVGRYRNPDRVFDRFQRKDVGGLDTKKNNEFDLETIDSEGISLKPGTLYLMHTIERVCAKNLVPVVDGKSSIGRLGVSVHQTAGFGDAGFDGQYTLEVTCVHPVILYAGMRIAQIRFHEVVGDIQSYSGNYVGDYSRGPVPSRSWKQFADDLESIDQ